MQQLEAQPPSQLQMLSQHLLQPRQKLVKVLPHHHQLQEGMWQKPLSLTAALRMILLRTACLNSNVVLLPEQPA